MVVGATGPLSMALLLKEFNDNNKVIATQAALMSLTHNFKIFAFSFSNDSVKKAIFYPPPRFSFFTIVLYPYIYILNR